MVNDLLQTHVVANFVEASCISNTVHLEIHFGVMQSHGLSEVSWIARRKPPSHFQAPLHVSDGWIVGLLGQNLLLLL